MTRRHAPGRGNPLLALLALYACAACGAEHGHGPTGEPQGGHQHGEGEHAHEDGGHEHDAEGHGHDEVPLGEVQIGPHRVRLAQGHGLLSAGEEGHLVVALPFTDGGETTVRAWIGSEDRASSFVGRGEYAAEHDDYDVHATAPDPLPANARWWVELELPDGARHVGSIPPRASE